MSDGTSLRIIGGWLEKYFHFDKNGALIPSKDSLRTEYAASKVSSLLKQYPDLEREMSKKIFSTDVDFATRPDGSFPVIAGGIPLFGPSPLSRLKFSEKVSATVAPSREGEAFLKRCQRRANKEINWLEDAISTAEKLTTKNEAEEAIKQVELDQVMTGGGYDNTEMFSITNSLLDFLVKCADEISFADGPLSEMLVRNCKQFKEELSAELGIADGSLRVTSFVLVRMMQESDGMLGFPVFKRSGAKLTKDVALRLSAWSGVDCRWMVSRTNKMKLDEARKRAGITSDSKDSDESRAATVLDAMCYTLDNLVVDPDSVNVFALIWTLARIQRHGYKKVDGKLTAKPGKARSVSPNAALSAGEEAMSFDSFIKVMKEKKVSWMPSLQDRKTADELIWNWYERVLVPKGMRALPADWSGYDKTVKGCVLATILYYVVRPFYHFDDQKWVDLAIVSLVYKYFFINRYAAEANTENWEKVKKNYTLFPISDDFYLVGTYNGLGSGAKLTHVGGSLYGELLIHHCIPEMLGYQGVSGPQAGDDTSLAVPENMIYLDSAEKTYAPISKAAAEWGLDLNASKQMWVVGGGEVMNIFLQYNYNYNLGIKGVGTAARYYVAYPFAEREKFLSIGEQYMAVISKFNNGVSNPWIEVWIAKWLSQDDYICALFKEYGVEAFNDVLVKSIGTSLAEVSERLELTYNWGLTREELEKGDIPVLPIIADVASRMSPRATAAEAISKLKLLEREVQDAKNDGGYDDLMDIGNIELDSDITEDASAE